MRTIRQLFIGLAIVCVAVCGCASTPTDSPDSTLQLLFETIRSGEETATKALMSGGWAGKYGFNQMGKIFSAKSGVTGIETEVLKNEGLKAKVLITLVGKDLKGVIRKVKGNKAVKLVFIDGGWKIEVKNMDWPKSLRSSNYK